MVQSVRQAPSRRFPWLLAAILLMGAAGQAGAQATVDDLKKNAGTVFLLIGRQTAAGGNASQPVEGVYRFRRSVTGDDGTYYGIKLGTGDPFSANASDRAATPAFPVNRGRSLGVDKFLRVYLQDVDLDTTSHDVAAEGNAAHPTGSNRNFNASLNQFGRADRVVNQTHDLTGLAEILPSGQIRYPGRDLWSPVANVSQSGYQFPAHNYPGGGIVSDSFHHWTFNRVPGAVYVPPDDTVINPLTVTFHHDIYAQWGGPFPTGGSITSIGTGGGVPTPIPINNGFMTDHVVNHGGGGACGTTYPSGVEYRRWVSASFSRDIYKLQQYADYFTSNQLSITAGTCQAGDPVYSSVSYSASYEMRNNCNDGCVTSAQSGSVGGDTADARVVFSSFGQDLNTQRMYVALKNGGAPQLLQFTLGGSTNPCVGATWSRTQIPTSGNFLVKYITSSLGATNSTNYETVGISSRDASSEYFYLVNLPGNQFAVSSNLFLQGGIVCKLRKAAAASGDDFVDWEERVESDSLTDVPADSDAGSVNVGPGVTAISADGEGNIYFAKIENDPPTSALPAALYGGQTGVNVFDPTRNPYFVSYTASGSTSFTHLVRFRQNAGYAVYKVGRFGSTPIRLGFAPVGENRIEGQWNEPTTAWTVAPGPAQLVPPAVTVNNRAELAAVNVSFPPPVDGLNTVDIVHRGGTVNGPPQVPTSPSSISITEDAGEQFYDVENPPKFGGLRRINKGVTPATPIGYSNQAPSTNTDGDGSIGRYSSSVIWGADIGDTTKDFQYKWEVTNITHENAPNHDPNKGIVASLVTRTGGPGPAWTAANDFRMPSYLTPGRVEPVGGSAPDAGQVQLPLLKAKFTNPGRYRIRLYIRGHYWNMNLDPSLGLNGPVTFVAAPFGDHGNPADVAVAGEQIINVQALAPPPTTSFVYNTEIVGAASIAQPAAPVAADYNPAKIHAKALVSFYQGDHFDDSVGQMAKTSGVGTWAYGWHPTFSWGTGTPPNWTAPGATHPLPFNVVPRNDGDHAGGTQKFYGGTDMDTTDPTSQMARDWYDIKYEWIGHYVKANLAKFEAPGATVNTGDPGVPPGGANPDFETRVLRTGNLSELVVLQNMGAATATSLLGTGEEFIRRVTVANPPGMSFSRVYEIKLPLLDTQPGRTVLTAQRGPQPSAGPVGDPSPFFHVPVASGFVANAPIWYVPTEPVPVKLSCRFYYPKVTWTKHRTDPALGPLVDAANQAVYYDLIDDSAVGWTAGRPGYFGHFKNGNGLLPQFAYTGAGASDLDDYMELTVTKTSPPYMTSTVNTFSAEAGATAAADLQMQFRDFNPYLHFASFNTVKSDVKWPRMTALSYEFGSEGVTGRDSHGVGLLAANATMGFDLSRLHSTTQLTKSFPGEPVSGANSFHPAIPTSYKFTKSSMPTMETTWTKVYDQSEGRVWSQSDIDGLNTGAGSTFNATTFWSPGASSIGNARSTTYQLAANDLPLPLFHNTVTPAGVNVPVDQQSLRMYSRFEDGVRTVPIVVGSFTITDTQSPPHLRVLVLNEKTQQGIYYVVENDYRWDATGRPILPYRSIVKKMDDLRAPFPGQAPDNGYYLRFDPTTAPTNVRVTTPLFPSIGESRVYDFATDFGVPTVATMGDFLVEEDVRLQIRAWATDNTVLTPPIEMQLGSGALQELSPIPLVAEGPSITRVTTRVAHHTFSRANTTNTIIVTTRDGSTAVQIRIPVRVVSSSASFRPIGGSNR